MYNLTPRPKVVTLPHGASKLPQAGKTAACASRGFFVPEIRVLIGRTAASTLYKSIDGWEFEDRSACQVTSSIYHIS
mgnify:CR=1 FL=1